MDTTNWKWFNVVELFHPVKCKCSNATELLTPGHDIAYVGAKKSENGIMAYVERIDSLVTKGNCIVFIGDGQGSVGYCLYQPNDFIGSTTLHAGYHQKLNAINAQFIIAILDCERYRYSFGRKYNKIALNKTNILLPADSTGEPDWQFMEDYVKNTIIPQLPKKAKKIWMQTYDKKPIHNQKLTLNTNNWKWFNVVELFHPVKCKCSNATELLTPGHDIAYIGAKKSENGIMAYVERVDSLVTKGNCIVFIGDGQGSVGYCLYQPNDFIGSTTLHAGYHQKLNATNAQFIIAILDCERYRYSFGRKYNKIALNKTNILLPADSTDEPDWQFMENYIKSLPYSRNI